MKRNEFIKTCAAGFCGCGVLGLFAQAEDHPESPAGQAQAGQAAATQTPAVPDEVAQLRFQYDGARERFAKLLAVMHEELDEAARGRVLRRLGRECALRNAKFFEAHRGDLAGFVAKETAWLEKAEYDEKAGLLRVVGKPGPCYCPLVKKGQTLASFCMCTLGWQEATYSIILNKPVTAEIEETILGGGSRCSFRIKF